ncbi:uncharacterized protein V6R79_002502 [Siganus canaliculatus]
MSKQDLWPGTTASTSLYGNKIGIQLSRTSGRLSNQKSCRSITAVLFGLFQWRQTELETGGGNLSLGTMQSFIAVSHLLLALLLQQVPAQISHSAEKSHSKVMPFQEVLVKSMCRPMEQLVDVEQEYPGEVEYIYLPACVPLWRCSGCCADENLECQPVLERNITLQVMRIHPMIAMHHVELTFVEHQSCECRVRPKLLDNSKSSEFMKKGSRRKKLKKTANGCGKCQFPQNKIHLH